MAETVQLFATCLLDTLYPEVGESVIRILNRCGATVEFPPGQTCCGQPAYNAGMRSQARKLAEHTIRVFEPTQGWVIVPSGSCAAMIRYSYLELFSGDENWLPRAREAGGAHGRADGVPGRYPENQQSQGAISGQNHLPLLLPPAARASRRPAAPPSAAGSGGGGAGRAGGHARMLRLRRGLLR